MRTSDLHISQTTTEHGHHLFLQKKELLVLVRYKYMIPEVLVHVQGENVCVAGIVIEASEMIKVAHLQHN
jgi:hypothetical protein